ncbi:MAG: sel1 repeat family protein [Sphingomonadales bacterium]|nr:sel1 repeat family protein [Sphingomonadales bacterium]
MSRRFISFILTAWIVVTSSTVPVANARDKNVPRAVDGYSNGSIFNGKQNMPTILYGVAADWDKACRKGSAASCARLGSAFDQGLGDLSASTRIAVGFYIKACDLGDGGSCAAASRILREGWAEFTDAGLSYQYAARGCETLGNEAACASLGLLHFRGLAPASDSARAIELWRKSCASGEDDGCRLQAGALFYETSDAASQKTALPLFEQACGRNLAWGCAGLADAYRGGKAVAQNAAKAETYARKGCLDAAGSRVHVCGVLARYLVQSGDRQALNRGELLLDRSCQASEGDACAALAQVGLSRRAGATTTLLEAVNYARRGCDLGAILGCTLLARAYAEGTEVTSNAYFRIALTERSCALGDQASCDTLKSARPYPADYARQTRINPAWSLERQLAAALTEVDSGDRQYGFMRVARLMEEGDEEASWWLGNWYLYGLAGAIEPNKGNAMILIENAAMVGHVAAAEFMGMAYWSGDGVPASHAKGEKYMAIAANRGSESAQAILRSMKQEGTRTANRIAYAEGLRRWEAYFAQQKRIAAANAGSYSGSGSGSSASSRAAAASWARYERAADNAAFNSKVNNIMHGTACVGSYC